MRTPYGPHRLTAVRQVAIPAELLKAVGLEPGDRVYFVRSDRHPDVIEIVPTDVLVQQLERGARPYVGNASTECPPEERLVEEQSWEPRRDEPAPGPNPGPIATAHRRGSSR